jgi:hypothetical protein
MSKNLFTQKGYAEFFKSLDYSNPLPFSLTSVDPIYFHVRSFLEKTDLTHLSGLTDPFREVTGIEAGGFASVPYHEKDLHEFAFLENLGLAMRRDDTYYISRFAYLLYDENDGLFREGFYNDRDAPPVKLRKLTPLLRVFLVYILPGNYWKAYYARQRLPDTIGPAAALDHQMREIEQWWLSIRQIVDLPADFTTP